jgi:hypothetical protein
MPDRPYADSTLRGSPPPDPEAHARANAALRRDFIDAGMPEGEADAMLMELERLLQA